MTQKDSFSQLPSLQTGKEILSYFENTKNSYTCFILQKQNEQAWLSCAEQNENNASLKKSTFLPPGFEMHHKIPKHVGGSDIEENLLPLSYDDHTHAHKLLYEVYGSHYDFCAWNMRIGKTAEANAAFRQGVVNQMRTLKQGRFDSENQRKCGQKNKGIVKKPHTKNKYIAAAFEKGMFWVLNTGEEVHIPPGSMQSVSQLTEKLLFGFDEKHQRHFETHGVRSYPYVGINKILSGWRDSKTNKCMFCVGPWKLGGVFVSKN
jgi:hypothetical protein